MNALFIVMALVCVVPLVNYAINKRLGMSSAENMRETRMWGIGFAVYAALDHLLLSF